MRIAHFYKPNTQTENCTWQICDRKTTCAPKSCFIILFSEDIKTLLKRVLSVAYRWRKMILAITFWVKIDYCFTIIVCHTMLWVRISIRARRTTLCDKVHQRLAAGLWFSPVLRFPQPIKLTATIYLAYCWNWR